MPGKKPWEGNLTHNPFENLKKIAGEVTGRGEQKEEEEDREDEINQNQQQPGTSNLSGPELEADAVTDLQERFRDTLVDRFPKVKELFGKDGLSFLSDLEGITHIDFTMPNEKEATQINIIVFYKNEKEEEEHQTFTLWHDKKDDRGIFSGSDRAFRKVGHSREEIFDEVLTYFESLKLDFWVKSNIQIISRGHQVDQGEGKKRSTDTEGAERVGRPIDMRKIEFFQSQPGSLFCFYNEIDGLTKGYQGIVFRSFVVLENPQYSNATYFIPIDPPLDRKRYGRSLSKEKMLEVLAMPWTENASKNRQELKKLVKESPEKFSRINHEPDGRFEEWKEKISEVIHEKEQVAQEK